MLLSDRKVQSAKIKAKQYKLSDGEGLYLLVHSNGSKYWRYKYSFAEKERVFSIGKYPNVSLLEARERKLDCQKMLRGGVNPLAKRKQDKLLAVYRDRNSFHSVAEEWKERNIAIWTPRHADRTWRRLENHVFPHLGERAIAEIEPLEVLAIVRRVEKEGWTETSRIVLRICSSVFRFGIATGRLIHNPAINLSDALQPHKVKHYP